MRDNTQICDKTHEAALHGSSGYPPWKQGVAILFLQDVPS